MGWVTALQPNSLICIYDTVVDCIIYDNLTDHEYLKLAVKHYGVAQIKNEIEYVKYLHNEDSNWEDFKSYLSLECNYEGDEESQNKIRLWLKSVGDPEWFLFYEPYSFGFCLNFYPPVCSPLYSINDITARMLSGNDLRTIINRHIENALSLNISVFPKGWSDALRRDFVEPCLKDGFPQEGFYHTNSKLLFGKDIHYRVNVFHYSEELRDFRGMIESDKNYNWWETSKKVIHCLKYGTE